MFATAGVWAETNRLRVLFEVYSGTHRQMPPYTARVMSDQEFADILLTIPPPPDANSIPLLKPQMRRTI
jgi:hypothetical protein